MKEKSGLKSLIIFVLLMIVMFIVGTLVGAGTACLQDSDKFMNALSGAFDAVFRAVPFICLMGISIAMIVVLCLYGNCNAMYQKLQKDMEDDKLWDSLENRMNVTMIMINILIVADMFFFGIIMAYFDSYNIVILVVDMVLVAVVGVLNIVLCGKLVNIEKSLNPQKKGNVLDLRFDKIWMETADEAEKMIIYKSGYSAFKTTNSACGILWVVTFVGMLCFEAGAFAYSCVCIIWLINTITYTFRGARLEKLGDK